MAEAQIKKNIFTISSSPHVRCDESVSKIMWSVCLALTPAAVFGVFNFGIHALEVIITGIIAAVVTEYFVEKVRNKPITITDGSAFLTGLLLSMCLPPDIPPYMVAIGSFIAIAIAKHSMGGLGQNIFNPAHIGRAALMVSWPVAMTTWSKLSASGVDAVTTATPLGILKLQGYSKLLETFGGQGALYKAMFLGTRNGSIGETSTILLVLGGLYLIYKKYINWQIPVVMIGTVGILTWAFGGTTGIFTGDPVFHMMAGGLVIGAFFMATDMVTIPMTIKGQIIFALGAGALTSLIRLKGGYPEGVCYSILLMNAVTPLIDKFTQPVKFGTRR
ncbi:MULTISPECIES: RnfABCDGE type electron transport complex subunit D [Clostridium]|uniref:Proton-translocating ferredoxin:NAD(+) oxidoreductase complex subunit D n=5 Tax=Clostridium TaxID=1485 RepID=RNFD_CLOLD|nr:MULTISPECIES: RnfABCDGE type electron transport complex subunit D [Clostridium]D8GR67.1 RecName: Full=Proton-translocating ferredoxin:NAD(+) oxidoreductase complex subunit D; AltName: Full=Rnf electron transport complex subunit D [Clostridium ljungdahlii DSM 13528]ADK14205.1 electron transport complex protein RnfD [Clostridium ljungdahlii DSM 13528]AGY77431.1 RnfABCDGE type electron transport complex subunit D [Clostridium autoethanogenum DSM 10061]ALU37572.1 Electron transport complex subun